MKQTGKGIGLEVTFRSFLAANCFATSCHLFLFHRYIVRLPLKSDVVCLPFLPVVASTDIKILCCVTNSDEKINMSSGTESIRVLLFLE